MQPKRLSVLGVGLLGGSLGLAVKAAANGCVVVGYGHRAATLNAALKRGAIDEAYDDPAAAVRDADLIVLCTPVGMLGEMLDRIRPALSPTAIVTDVGSTKRRVVAHARAVFPAGEHRPGFVGSHPMAGSEKRGVEHAQADLFKGAVCIVTPDEATDARAADAVESFWRLLGMRTTRMAPAEHDRRIADVSHLPHAVAAALVRIQHEESLSLAGRGFSDATRIAGGDGGLWRDILLENGDNLADGVRRLRRSLDGLLAMIERGDGEAVKGWLDEAAHARLQFAAARTAHSADA